MTQVAPEPAEDALPELIDTAARHDYFVTAETLACLERNGAPEWLVWWAEDSLEGSDDLDFEALDEDPDANQFSWSLGYGHQTGGLGGTIGYRHPNLFGTGWRQHSYFGAGFVPHAPSGGFVSAVVGTMNYRGDQHRFVFDACFGVIAREVRSDGSMPILLGNYLAAGYEYQVRAWGFSVRALGGVGWAYRSEYGGWIPTFQIALGT